MTDYWRGPATFSLLMQAAGLALLSSWGGRIIGHALHDLTGRWNLDELAGHYCYLAAWAGLLISALSRLGDERTLREATNRHVKLPLAVAVPVLGLLFFASDSANQHSHGLVEVDHGPVLIAYWLVLLSLLAYLSKVLGRALWVLREHEAHRRSANLQLLGVSFLVLTTALSVANALTPPWPDGLARAAFWVTLTLATIFLVYAHIPRGLLPQRRSALAKW